MEDKIMRYAKRFLIALAVLFLCLTGCDKKDPEPVEPVDPVEELTPAEISEKAMENFQKKLEEGHYTLEFKDHVKINVVSKDFVWFDYKDGAHNPFAAMSVNNEAFQGFLVNDELRNIAYLGEGQALDMASSRLPNYWFEITGGNIFDVFYNQTDKPLEFISKDETVKNSLLASMGYGDMALMRMEDVYLEMDAMDPKVVTIKSVIQDDEVARYFFDDVDAVLTFDEAEGNTLVENWMKEPVYPEARTAWTPGDHLIMNSVLMCGYDEDALPFPDFASYALTIDPDYLMTDQVIIRDPHATEENAKNYVELLKKDGFTETTDKDGDTVYRKLLREEYSAYEDVFVGYNNGVDIIAELYYDSPKYDTLSDLNAAITKLGYLPLPETENFTAIHAEDIASKTIESWLYFFDYKAVIDVTAEYKDHDEADKYMSDYLQSLLDAGFTPVYEGGDEEPSYYDSPDGTYDFRYVVKDDSTVVMRYKADKYVEEDEAEKLIEEAGFAAIDLNAPASCRDLRRFYQVRNGLDFKLYLSLYQTFANTAEAEAFLDAYEAKLNEAGFERRPSGDTASRKSVTIYNEEKGLTMGVDLFPGDTKAQINIEFIAE